MLKNPLTRIPAGAAAGVSGRGYGWIAGVRQRLPRLRHVAVSEVAPRGTLALVVILHLGEAVVDDGVRGGLVHVVEGERVLGEDRTLHLAVGGTQRLEAVLLLHVLGDLQAAEALDLP